MKNILSIISIIIGFSFAIAQENYKEFKLESPVKTQTNNSYRLYFNALDGVYINTTKIIETSKAPISKFSPLGNQVLMILDKKIGIYDTWNFKMELETKNPLKEDPIKEIIPNTYGENFYLITSSGALYETKIINKKINILKKNVFQFVSKGFWNPNLNSLLLADDFYLSYYNPVSQKVESDRIKLPSDITSLYIDPIAYEVFVGLSNGSVSVFSQDLTQQKYTLKVSNNSISSIVKDPLDHYIHVGDENGMVMTVDLLKRETIKKIKNHNGSVTLGYIYDILKKRKFIVSTGLDSSINILETSKLEPNFRRLIELELIKRKNRFISRGLSESTVSYDNRVNNNSLKKFTEKTISNIVDSIAVSKLLSPPKFKIIEDSLEVVQAPFPAIKIKLFKPLKSVKGLVLDEAHYALEKDNTFSISDIQISDEKVKIRFSADKRKMMQYEEEVSLETSKEVAEKEREFKQSLKDLVAGLRSEGKLNDVDLSVTSVLKKEKDSLGNDELNLHVTFVSKGIKAEVEGETADYKSGKYDVFESTAATTLVDFFLKSTAEKLTEYLSPKTKITFKLTGSTDKSGISSALPYQDEYGTFKNFPFYFQGQLAGLSINKESGIKNNSQLGFLRTYSVRNFIENFSDVFEETTNKFIHYSEESQEFGAEHRKIKIEMIIHKISELPKSKISRDERPLSDVDVNIPKGEKVNGYALIIGNEDYSSFQRNVSKESDVPYAVRDGETFVNYLTQMYGFEKENIDFLRNATFGEMSQAISKLERLMDLDGENKEIVVYYSGHGMPEDQTNEPYLIPVDITGMNVSQGISLKELMSRLSNRPHGKISIIIDACFSGLGKVEPLSSVKGITVIPVNPELGENMLLLSSSSGNESSVVDDKNQHGLFTYHLLKLLKENNGDISIEDLYSKLRKDVGLSAIRNLNKIQTPSILVGKKLESQLSTRLLFENE